MTATAIFRDREILSPRFIPDRLAHRDENLNRLESLFQNADQSPESWHLKTVQLIGPSGSGKTSCIQVFARRLGERTEKFHKGTIKHVYVNLKLHGGSRVILYRYLLQLIAPEIHSLSMGAEEMLTQLIMFLKEKNLFLILSLDELDYWLKSTKETSVIYDLARLNEIDPSGSCNVLGIIFAARNTEFYRYLDSAELSTLGRIPIQFRRYNGSEIADILSDRIILAFQPKAIDDEVIQYVSNIAAAPPSNGDVRYALDLLSYAGSYAETNGEAKVTPEHIRSLIEHLHPTVTEEDILDLPKIDHLLVLMGVVMALRGAKKAYCTLKEIREEVEILERTKNKPGLTNEIEDILQDLSDRGILEIRSLREVGINGVPLEKLNVFLNVLFRRLESGLMK
jgi:archaeal cell division control protein 6